MQDQASGLRRMMGHGPRLHTLGVFATDASLSAMATAHLAHAMASRGTPVWAVDEAAAPRNMATQFGVHPRQSLDQAVRRDGDASAAVCTVEPGLQLLMAGGGMAWLSALPEMRWRVVVDDLLGLSEQPEWLIVHAAVGREETSLALCAQERLLVVPQAKTGLTQAYALIKAVHQQQPVEHWHVLVMQANGEHAARQTFATLDATTRRFLGLGLRWLGSVPRDPALIEASRRMQPVQERAAGKPGVAAFRQLAESMMAWPEYEYMYKPDDFWLKMWMFSRLTAEAALEKVQNVQLN